MAFFPFLNSIINDLFINGSKHQDESVDLLVGTINYKTLQSCPIDIIVNDNQSKRSNNILIECNGKIHLIVDKTITSTNASCHYIYNISTGNWTQLSNLPSYISKSPAVVYNGELHVFGIFDSSVNLYRHYKFNETTGIWTPLEIMPYEATGGRAVVYDDYIYLIGGSGIQKGFYRSKGTGSWESVAELPISFSDGFEAVVCNNRIHLFGFDGVSNDKCHYVWNGVSWSDNLQSNTCDTVTYNYFAIHDVLYSINKLAYTIYYYNESIDNWLALNSAFSPRGCDYNTMVIIADDDDNTMYILGSSGDTDDHKAFSSGSISYKLMTGD